ncbi:hypothetical protein QBC47DRAFT_97479 [Echria macrotheca]|uniref:Rds1 protein n=1 Tax=Echria macrotheca TaxID=438768 RepID=A0AAJ0FFC0_9PEZI|nr:hypothetical protein QBC47DRAFT_97479 [Echria macrotheca]
MLRGLLQILPLLGAVQASPTRRSTSRYSQQAQELADPTYGPIPGESDLYNTYWGTDAPFPGYITDPVYPTRNGPPGVDDVVWQNLLAAEWIVFHFYQRAVEMFTPADFVAAGMPSQTYRRIQEIRNNEAGHLRIFQNMISPTSIKPGACKYKFPFTDPMSFLALMTAVELSSMTFLTGLVQQPRIEAGRAAMVAIAEVETRHSTWALMDIWKVDPFGGPIDTVFPYANEILETTMNAFVIPGSCPSENPEYPNPRLRLPTLSAGQDTKSLTPGSTISLEFPDPNNQPRFDVHTRYYVVFFHGVNNVSVPIDVHRWPRVNIWVTIPSHFETKGVVVAVVADEPGAPTKESLVAGPGIIMQQPAALAASMLRGEYY